MEYDFIFEDLKCTNFFKEHYGKNLESFFPIVIHIISLCLNKIQKQVKVIYAVKSQSSGYLWGR